MIEEQFQKSGFCVYKDPALAELAVECISRAKWQPYRDIEKLEVTDDVKPILAVMASRVLDNFQIYNAKSDRLEVWRGCVAGAAEYHSDAEDEQNDFVAIVCVETGTYPISFVDTSTGQETHLFPEFGDVILINHNHPTVLHKGPITNGPTNEFIIGQFSFRWI